MSRDPRVIFEGRVIRLEQQWITQPDGRASLVETARHPGGAVALPLAADGQLLLLRQFRPCLGGWLWEAPAGKLDPGESPEATARRELAEEAGLEATNWQGLGRLVTAPGFSDEVLHLFLARELTEVAPNPEEDEHMERHWLDLDQALAMADSGEINDAKTVAALYRAARLLAGMD